MRSHKRSHVLLSAVIIVLFASPCYAMGPFSTGNGGGIVTLADMWNSITSLGSPNMTSTSVATDTGGICPFDHSQGSDGTPNIWHSPGGSSSLPIWGHPATSGLSNTWNSFGADNIPQLWGPPGTSGSGALCSFDH